MRGEMWRLRPADGPVEDRNLLLYDVHDTDAVLRPADGPGEDRNGLWGAAGLGVDDRIRHDPVLRHQQTHTAHPPRWEHLSGS
ncbi:hypothetical protein NKG94_50940 [Micromonospora sp. M12]